MSKIALNDLPDELIIDVLSGLDNRPADIAHFSAAGSRRLHNLVQSTGWRSYVRDLFPHVRVPAQWSPESASAAESPLHWNDLARRLTYNHMCWEKRALISRYYMPVSRTRNNRKRTPGIQSVPFNCHLDAAALPDGGEVLVCGAGEDVLVRMHGGPGSTPGSRGLNGYDHWNMLKGRDIGYWPGTGDVTAVSIMHQPQGPCAVLGRANGDLQLLSVANDETFGRPTGVILSPLDDSEVEHHTRRSMRKSPGQLAVSWTEWDAHSCLLATCRNSVISLYDVKDAHRHSQSGDNLSRLSPVTYHNVATASLADEPSLLRGFKFLGNDSVACALGGSRDPLRWGKIRPTGLEMETVLQQRDTFTKIDARLSESLTRHKTTVRAIETVGHEKNDHLLLSAWNDGTYRLCDVRTSAPHDAIYRDTFQPYQSANCLLVYEMERFVAGSNTVGGANLRIFDFRYPKPYHYTSNLPCSTLSPRGLELAWPPARTVEVDAECDAASRRECHWHESSKSNAWRRDATLFLGRHSLDGVVSLAKSSSMSDSFYCGVRGGLVQKTLQLSEDVNEKELLSASTPDEYRVDTTRGEMSMMETGVSLCSTPEWKASSVNNVPKLYRQVRFAGTNEAHGVNHDISRGQSQKERNSSRRRRLDLMWRLTNETEDVTPAR